VHFCGLNNLHVASIRKIPKASPQNAFSLATHRIA
jgi:hypothetical protein